MRKKLFIFVPIFLSFVIIFCAVTPMITMSEDISTKVFRLHILANSDDTSDQQLKLKVRDEILELSKGLFFNCANVEDAVRVSNENLELLKTAAEKVIQDNGAAYSIKVYTAKEYFNTRYYDNFTLPAGIYDSLKIEIGEGKGHNWWCVMFPSVCLSGCTEDFDGVLTEEEKALIESDKYIVRFKIVEVYEELKDKIN